ncbi:carboxymuconolactone decarboxylase family protein [Gulosibacter sp. ACHW.36C]|uniref:Carboxymuconolactone decarboxylase family protein n=1 Tax=Gulosibacter sediminis TaxID=1729695 RepID=A0ABY4MUP9_9MICO|nr:carboxymuconolactone decarboxylase family protein [Gulosibacter sediminis]UQN14151.1 carboxymuconolactone decarboxylase family protein [Gulosibacter sediminis]
MQRDELYEIGLAQRRNMFGVQGAEDQVEHTTDVNDKIQEFVTRVCFGDIWQRPGLALKDRSKITLAMLIAQGKSHEIRIHIRGALANGVTPLELRELIVHSILYIGIPGAVEGIRALEEILDEQGLTFELDGESHRDGDDTLADATSGKAGQA